MTALETYVLDSNPYAEPLPPGTVLAGKYRLGEVVGQGGFGITYKAWDDGLKRPVAVKEYCPRSSAARKEGQTVLQPLGGTQTRRRFEEGRKRFQREAETLAKLNHPNVVPVHDVLEANGTAYLVMTFIDGPPLSRVSDLAPAVIEREAARLLDALASLHKLGLIHCDIKPANILRGEDGHWILIDFGSTKRVRLDGLKGSDDTLPLALSPAYAPPELLHPDPPVSPAADVFSLAATLYEMVAGATPPGSIQRLTDVQVLGKDPLLPLSAIRRAGISRGMIAFVDRALSIDRERRPSLAEARRLLTGQEKPNVQISLWLPSLVLAGMAGVPLMSDPLAFDPLALAGGRDRLALALLLLGLGGLWWWLDRRLGAARAALAVSPGIVLLGALALERIAPGLLDPGSLPPVTLAGTWAALWGGLAVLARPTGGGA